MEVQRDISTRRLARLVGRDLDVLIDDVPEDGTDGTVIGRCYADAPEIDGSVRITTTEQVRPGDMLRVRITGSDDYDLEGETI